jgi:arylsulfatase
MGSLTSAGETRAALLGRAGWDVPLPGAALLTFGMAINYAGEVEPPGWYQLTVRVDDAVVEERRLNPRALRGFRDVSVLLEGPARNVRIDFDLRLTDRHGVEIPTPRDLLLGVTEPTLHSLESYGKSPGVILISIDTLRRDHVGAYGYSSPTTPALDELADTGLLAEDTVSTSSWTLPAHLSMLTSVDPGAHGGTDMEHGFNGRVPTLAETLRSAGFATRAITSHLYVSNTYGLDAGFDHLDFHQDRKAADGVDRALAWLDRVGDEPFFLFLHFYDPHWHYDPPAETLALFESEYSGDLTGLWQDFSRREPKSLSPGDMRHLLALYDGEIRYTDDQIARLLAHLRERGLDASTLVVVTSDHGEEFLEHGAFEHQRTLYEEIIRVPLIVNGPGIAPGRLATQTSLLDVAPTILDWAEVTGMPDARGRSLLEPIVRGRESYGETDHTTDNTRKLFLRGEGARWKAIFSLDPAGETLVGEEWYDLNQDPAEHASTPPASSLADSIRGNALQRWREGRRTGSEGPAVTLSKEETARLRALGYISN